MWAMIVRKLIWAFLTLNFLLSKNHKVCNSRESRSTDFSLQEIKFSDVEYDDKKEHCDKKDLI